MRWAPKSARILLHVPPSPGSRDRSRALYSTKAPRWPIPERERRVSDTKSDRGASAHAGAPPGEAGVTDLSFGRWLRRRRKALDLTQAELGERVGCAAVTVHKIETDQLRPSRQMAYRLADELAVAPTERDAFLRFARAQSHAPPAPLVPSVPGAAGSLSPRQRHNLPIAPTRFFGREAEVSSGCMLLGGPAGC